MKTVYIKNSNKQGLTPFSEFMNELLNEKKTFKVTTTNYTKTVVYKNKRIVFNDDGKQDVNALKLINMVKTDANNFLKNNKKRGKKRLSDDINWYYYNDTLGDRYKNGTVVKVDLTSAYWVHATNIGLLSQKTINFFNSLNLSKKKKKYARLKALGSLATIKRQSEYVDGVEKTNEIVDNPKTQALYLSICDDVAEVMREFVVGYAIYSYWDCIFLDNRQKRALDSIEHYFKSKGFDCTFEENAYKIYKNDALSFLETTKLDKKGKLKKTRYPIKNEQVTHFDV